MSCILYKGGHDDLRRVYPMMEFDYARGRLAEEAALHRAMWDGKGEIYLLKDENMMEHGYFFALTDCPMKYILGMWFGIYPNYPKSEEAPEFLRLIAENYADKQGILWEVERGREDADAALETLNSQGFEETGIPLSLGGRDAALLCRNIKAASRINVTVARIILRDLYSPLMTGAEFEKKIKIG